MSKGGKRPGAGRKEGIPNKANVRLREYAGQFTNEAVDMLVSILRDKKASARERLAASIAILDRGHGRPAQELIIPPPPQLDTFHLFLNTIRRLNLSDDQLEILETSRQVDGTMPGL